MPYTIARRDGRYCVYRRGADGEPMGDTLGCHDTRAEAIEQIAAVESAERRRRAAMSTTQIPFSLDAEPINSDGLVYRVGKVFEAGDYTDKQFSITPDELEQAIAGFAGCNLGLEHVPTVLDGKIGRLEKVSRDGAELFGVVGIPAWLDALLGDGERKVSAEFDRETKRFCGLHLVRSPRVTDAALMAAFNADGGGGKGRMRKAFDDLMTWAREHLGTGGGADPATSPPATGTSNLVFTVDNQSPSGVPAEFAGELAAMKRELEAEKNARIAEWAAGVEREAARFADDQIRSARALPVEREAIQFAYRQAALDDRRYPLAEPVTFGTDAEGKALSGSRLDGVRHQYNSRQPHDMLRELVRGEWPGDAALLSSFREETDAERATMSEERRKELLAHTATGRAQLAAEANGKGK